MTQADLLRDAVQALKFRRYDAALEATTLLLPIAKDAEPYVLHARALLSIERLNEARKTIEDGLTRFPNARTLLQAQDAMVLFRLRREDEAIALADQVLRVDPTNEWAVKAKAGTLRIRRQHEAAIETIEPVLAQCPNSALLNAEYAAILFNDTKSDEALVYADRALAEDPLSETALHTKTLLLIRKREREQAAEVLRTALTLNNDNSFVINLLAQQALDTRGDAEETIALAMRALALNPASESALQLLVHALTLADRRSEALPIVANTARDFPDLLTPLILLARLQMDAGDFESADATIEILQNRFPKNTSTHALTIDAHVRKGDVGRAIVHGYEALKARPNASEIRVRTAGAIAVLRRFAEAHRLLDEAPVQDFNVRVERVLLHIIEGTFDEAMHTIRDALAALHGHVLVGCLEAWVHANNGRFDEAHALLDEGRQQYPSDALPHVVTLDVLLTQGRIDEALKRAAEWLPRFRTSHDLSVTVAQAYLLARCPKDALATAEQVLKLHRSSTVAMQIKSMALCDLGKHRKALEVIEEGLAKFPQSMGLVAQRGYIRSRTPGQEALSERDFALAAHKNPAALLAKTCLGQIAYARRDYRKAQDYFRQVTNAQPHSAAAFTNLAWAYTAAFAAGGLLSDLDDAEDACNTALTLEASCARAIGCRGAIEFHRKRLSLAETLLLQAVAADPKDVDLAVNLGAFQARIGDYDSAAQTLRAALALGTQHSRCYVELSQLLAKQGQFDEARVFARRAIDTNPRSAEGWRSMAAVLAASQNLAEAEQTLRQALVRVDGHDNAAVRLDLARILLISSGSAASDTRNREALEHIVASTSRRDLPQARVLQAMAQLKTGAYQDAQKTLASVPLTADTEPHVRALQQVANSYVASERRGMDPNQRVAMFAFVMATIVTIFTMRVNDKLNDASFAVLLPLLFAFAVVVLALPMLASFKLGSTLEAQLALPTREQRNELIAGPSLDLDMPPTAQIVSGTMSFDN